MNKIAKKGEEKIWPSEEIESAKLCIETSVAIIPEKKSSKKFKYPTLEIYRPPAARLIHSKNTNEYCASSQLDVQINSESKVHFIDEKLKELDQQWSFYEIKKDIKLIKNVQCIADFTCFLSFPVSKLEIGSDLAFFKKEITPFLNDDKNISGGRWIFRLNWLKYSPSMLENYWLVLLNAIFKNEFENESAYINGIWARLRETYGELSLWTMSAKEFEIQFKIGLFI